MPDSTPAIALLRPLPSRVVLRRLEPASQPSPYVVPDSAKEKPVEAEVVAVPSMPTYEYGILIPCPLSVGDHVLVGKYAGDHKFRGEDICIVRWDEILAVIDDSADLATAAAVILGESKLEESKP